MTKVYYLKNKEQIRKRQKIYNQKNKKRIRLLKRKWYLKNKSKLIELRQINRKINKEKIAKQVKSYQEIHKDKIREYKKNYFQKNKNKIIQKTIFRLKTDINFKIAFYLRNRIRKVLKGINKSKSTLKLLDCSLEVLKKHLASKFIKGMSFNNYGKWHIDHIRPCASFNLRKKSEQCKCFHYTNLQPLWAVDNLIKSDNY